MAYLLESAFCLSCFYAFYWLFLRKKTFFQWNRWYLLLTPALAFLIPALYIPLKRPVPKPAPVLDLPALVVHTQSAPMAVYRQLEQPLASETGITLGVLFGLVYKIGAVLLAMLLIYRLLRLYFMIKSCKIIPQQGHLLAHTRDDSAPVASFFSLIFWHKTPSNERERLILEHEMVHVRQWHSLDVLFMEALVIWQWFNPLVYLYRRSLQAVHEYIADDYVVRNTRQKYLYASLLAQEYRDRAHPDLMNTFHAQLKNRLTMLAKNPSPRMQGAFYLLSFPLALSLMLLFSFRLIENPVSKAIHQVDAYARELSEITVNGHLLEKMTAVDRSTPYIFYWGLIQANIEYDNAQYVGEIHTSAATFFECIRREPRLWNGKNLEPVLKFSFLDQAFVSKLDDRSAYASGRSVLEQINFAQYENQALKIERIQFPDGKMGVISLYLDAKDPKWLMKSGFGGSDKVQTFADQGATYIQWGDRQYTPAINLYCTSAQLMEMFRQKPDYIRPDGQVHQMEDFAIRAAKPDGQVLIPLRDVKTSGWLRYPEVQKSLESVQRTLVPGIRVDLYASLGGQGTPIAAFTLVPEGDSRLNENPVDRSDYYLNWRENEIFGRIPQSYATEYIQHLHGLDTIYYISADQYFGLEGFKKTEAEMLALLDSPFRILKNGQAVEDFGFDLYFQDKKMRVEHGVLTDAQKSWLKSVIKPGTMLKLNHFSGKTFDLNHSYLNIDVVSQHDEREGSNADFAVAMLSAQKNKSDPTPTLCGLTSGNLTLTQLKNCKGLELRYNNAPAIDFEITSYAVTILPKNQDPITMNLYHAGFTRELEERMQNMLSNGGSLFFDDIVVRKIGTREVRNIGGIAFKIK